MLEMTYSVSCDAWNRKRAEVSPECHKQLRSQWGTSKHARAEARRLKWHRIPGTSVRHSGTDLCPPCAALNYWPVR